MITGDFITDELTPENSGKLADCLREYTRQVSTFACLGNHDGGTWSKKRGGYASPERVKSMLKAANANLLENSSKRLSLPGQTLVLSGVGDYWSEARRPKGLLRPLSARSGSRNDHSSVSQSDAKTAEELSMGPHAQRPHPRRADEDPVPRLCSLLAPVDRSMTEGLHDWEGRKDSRNRAVGNLWRIRVQLPAPNQL